MLPKIIRSAYTGGFDPVANSTPVKWGDPFKFVHFFTKL